ncbi:hypothetical protein [Priestia filamentosa]|uniref:hypothetical protein n=1 Tax=Priestia filamentosa TaxID=1402861 RepID=UPI0028940184|nr:hypothetical protein [Priestia filamentosa]MDT3766394.1 hypothetical protein [Priestia filamentosa]
MTTKCHVVISKEKEIIKDKNLIFNDVKKNIKKLDGSYIVHATISNWIRESFNKHKQVVQDEKTVQVDLNLSRNEFPIDELEYEGEIYPFSKTRLTVNKDHSDYAFITYIFDGGKEYFDLKPLDKEYIEILKRDEEFAAIKKRKWPEGFTNKWDKKIFEE